MKRSLKIFAVAVFIFLYIPMLMLIVGSFSNNSDLAVFGNFTFGNYSALMGDGTLLRLLLNSLIVAVLSSGLSTVLGTSAAVGIHSMGRRSKRLVMSITNIPLMNPEIVTGVSLALLFAFIGQLLKIRAVLGFFTLLIAHITFNLPYVILSVMPKLAQMDTNLHEAALDLGCTPGQSLRKVILPEIMPGVISGAMMAFTMSLDDFVISYFVYGPSFITLPVEIYNYTKKPLPPKIYALFTLLFLIILIIMVGMNLMQARDQRKTGLKTGIGKRILNRLT